MSVPETIAPEPLSVPQFEAFRSGRMPADETVASGIRAIPVPILGEFVVSFTYAYVVEDAAGDIHIIDPGWDSPRNAERLASSLAAIGRSVSEIRSITATHAHRDHLGLAPWIQRRSDATLHLHPLEWESVCAYPKQIGPDPTRLRAWGAPDEVTASTTDSRPAPMDPSRFSSVTLVEDGEGLPFAGLGATVLHTPGHTPGHIAVDMPAAGVVFTGDHLLPHLNPGVGMGHATAEDEVGDMIASLDRIAATDRTALPGHGYAFPDARRRALAIRRHIEHRRSEVGNAAAHDTTASVWDIASQVSWSWGFARLSGNKLVSALHQTELYLRALGTDRSRTTERQAR